MASAVFIRGVAEKHGEHCWAPGVNWCQACQDEHKRLCAEFWAIWDRDNGRV